MAGFAAIPMPDRSLFEIVELPFCQAVIFEHWNSPPGRFFVGYRSRHGFTALLGNGVVDEFRTISGPILFAPNALLGGIYDAGMQLADARDLASEIDQGWPPLTIGIDVNAPDRPDDWSQQFLAAVQARQSSGKAPWKNTLRKSAAGRFSMQSLRCRVAGNLRASIIVTDAPLLPQQLERLADVDTAPVTIAVSLGNRLPRVAADELQQVDVVSEQQLGTLLAATRRTIR
jgi:hypothetical protein